MLTDDELPAPSPGPLIVSHLLGVALHLLDGAALVGAALLAPAPIPQAGDPLTQTRFWLAAIGGFATVVALFFSTVGVVMAYRIVDAFLRQRGPRAMAVALVLGALVAHAVGCVAGIGGMGVAVMGTVFGEHGGPWSADER